MYFHDLFELTRLNVNFLIEYWEIHLVMLLVVILIGYISSKLF